MKCDHIKSLLPLYSDEALEPSEMEAVKGHLKSCPACREELAALQASWEALEEWGDIEPAPGYVSRFWTGLAQRKSWPEKLWDRLRGLEAGPFWAPVLVTACVAVIVSVLVVSRLQPGHAPEEFAGLNAEEIEMVENIELAEHFEIIQDLDFWENWDIMEDLEGLSQS